MRTDSFKGKMSSWFGQDVKPPIAFSGTYEAFGPSEPSSTSQFTEADWAATVEEIRAANRYPSNEDIAGLVNDKNLAKARAAKMQVVANAAGLEKPTLEDPQIALKGFIKILEAQKIPYEEAVQRAEAAIGVTLVR